MNRLEGKTILLTRSSEDSARWAKRLRGIGARPIVFPCIRCEPIGGDTLAKEFRQALDEYSRAIELAPRFPEAYYGRGCVYRLQGRQAEAIADFEMVITLAVASELADMARQQIEELML